VKRESDWGSGLPEAILERMRSLPHGRANYKQLVREMGARGARREALEAAIEDLARRGALIEVRGGHYVLASAAREYAVGRVSMHRDGYGFVIADRPAPGVRGDLFLPPGAAERAMHGDRVLARIVRVDADGRAEGEIARVLERAHPSLVGEFRLGRGQNHVIPHDTRVKQAVVIPEGLELPRRAGADRLGAPDVQLRSVEDLDGLIVNVQLLEYPGHGEDAVGQVIEVLGHPDDFGVDVEIVIRKHHLPHRFPAEALEEAQSIPGIIGGAELRGRRDFRLQDCVTIDGETARDFDDAVWVDRLPNGNFLLHAHIADVSHYVRPGSSIDREALARGTSVYFPDRAVPMLPLELSAGICSLLPGVDRLAMSALLEIDHRGGVVAQEFCRSVIRSVERMTYTAVHLILEGDAGLRARYGALCERFELMRELALILNRKRQKRGSIDFDLPEPMIAFDERGAMTGIGRSPRNIAHRIVEEFMLAANEAVAAHLERRLEESVYRVHEPPDPAKVLEFEELALRFGHSLGLGAVPVKRFPVVDRKSDGRKVRQDIVRADERLAVPSKMYQRLVERLQGRPEERIVNYLLLRSLKQARYGTHNVGHFALAARAYTHFTSPIRRYPDLLVHRLLGGLLDGRPAEISGLGAAAEQCSLTERRAAEAERELLEWKKVKFMNERVGDEFPALVTGTVKSGFFVELDELFVEGFVPLDTLPGERWTYQENTRRIVAERSRREIGIGGRVTVRLDRVDGVEKRLLFSLVLPAPERRRRRG
jgi:ribonuclease R